MRRDPLTISSIPMAIAWLAAILIGGLSGLIALGLCWLLLFFGGEDSASKHGISNTLSSRVGGVAVVFYLLVNTGYQSVFSVYEISSLEVTVLSGLILFFLIGLYEDLSGNTSAMRRFLAMLLLASMLVVYERNLILISVGISWADWVLQLSSVTPALFTALCIAFLPNAFNTADGANGLVGGLSLIALATLGALIPNTLSMLQLSGAVGCLIFLIFNLYTGRFFLGDGGAYALGALVGCSLIHVANSALVSTWFLLSLVFYPVADLMWSMVRRAFVGRPVLQPDDLHLHNLVFERVKRLQGLSVWSNNMTGMTIVTVFCLFPAILAWTGTLSLDEDRWFYIVAAQWLLYLGTWFSLRTKTMTLARG